jgi:hypothetical protein
MKRSACFVLAVVVTVLALGCAEAGWRMQARRAARQGGCSSCASGGCASCAQAGGCTTGPCYPGQCSPYCAGVPQITGYTMQCVNGRCYYVPTASSTPAPATMPLPKKE